MNRPNSVQGARLHARFVPSRREKRKTKQSLSVRTGQRVKIPMLTGKGRTVQVPVQVLRLSRDGKNVVVRMTQRHLHVLTGLPVGRTTQLFSVLPSKILSRKGKGSN